MLHAKKRVVLWLGVCVCVRASEGLDRMFVIDFSCRAESSQNILGTHRRHYLNRNSNSQNREREREKMLLLLLFLALPMKWGGVMKIRCVQPSRAVVATTPTLAGRRFVNRSRNLMIIRRNNITMMKYNSWDYIIIPTPPLERAIGIIQHIWNGDFFFNALLKHRQQQQNWSWTMLSWNLSLHNITWLYLGALGEREEGREGSDFVIFLWFLGTGPK